MWLLLPIVCVMIRVIIGSSDVQNVSRVQLKLTNGSQIIKPEKMQLHDSNLSRSSMDPDAMVEENDRQKIIHKRSAEEINDELWNPLQESEILSDDSFPYLPLRERSSRSNNVLDASQEKKSPAFHPWGGKRSQGYLNDKAYFLINKDNKSFLDKDVEKNFLEYAKRLPNFGRTGRRTPFHSWGGKRSAETEFDANGNIEVDIIPEDKIDLYLSTDTLPDDTMENNISESIENEKRAAQTKNNKLKVGFHSWGGKRNNIQDYWKTEESNFKDAFGKSINAADQLSISGKRAVKGYTNKIHFHPWGGKGSQGYLNDKAYFLINKDNKSFLDKDVEKNFLEYTSILPNFGRTGRRTPFHSWGGKRSAETEFDANGNIEVDIIPEDKIDLYLSTDTLPDDTMENNISESIENEKRAAQTKNDRLKVGFHSWGGKRNNIQDYWTTKESNFKDAFGKSINAADQLYIPGKRAARGYTNKIHFYPWGGNGSRGYLTNKTYFLINKDNKSFLDKDVEKNFLEYAKRLPNFGRTGRRTPFHSWGGKRSAETEFDANGNIEVDIIPEDKIDLYLSTDTLPDDTIENNISESIENEKRAAQTKNNRLKDGFHSWGGKRNNIQDYWTTKESNFKDAFEKSINAADQLSITGKGAAKG